MERKHTENWRVTVIGGFPSIRNYYFNDKDEAMVFAQSKAKLFIVFLLAHAIDGVYEMVKEVTPND